MSCQCKTTGAGTIVCDPCAVRMIEAASSLLKGDQYATFLPGMLKPEELKGMRSVLKSYFSDLETSQAGTHERGGQA